MTHSNVLTDKKKRHCVELVEQAFALLEAKTCTREIMTRKVCVCVLYQLTVTNLNSLQAFENAITIVYALGGSTNSVLHLLALAHE